MVFKILLLSACCFQGMEFDIELLVIEFNNIFSRHPFLGEKEIIIPHGPCLCKSMFPCLHVQRHGIDQRAVAIENQSFDMIWNFNEPFACQRHFWYDASFQRSSFLNSEICVRSLINRYSMSAISAKSSIYSAVIA